MNEDPRHDKQQIEETSSQGATQQDVDFGKSKSKSFLGIRPVGLKGRSHPVYRTTNSTYGDQEVDEIHKSKQYYGQKGAFTKEFVGGMYRDHSLNCNKTRSLVLPDPSFTNNENFPNEN